VLVAGASNIVGTVAPGTSGNVLTSNGTDWTSAAGGVVKVSRQVFTSSGTYTPTTGTKFCDVELLGGGGGGGGCAASVTTGSSCAGGGGGGGYIRKVYPVATVTGATVTVGGGGAGGAAGANPGITGGATIIGVLLQANGGNGGAAGINVLVTGSFTNAGGTGGNTGGGDVNINGNIGGVGIAFSGFVSPSFGANSVYGSGATPAPIAGPTSAASGLNAPTGFGGGGSGAFSLTTAATALPGGKGSGGIVIITEYA
jgi:hypothetical protein